MRAILLLLSGVLLSSCVPHHYNSVAAGIDQPQLRVRGEGRVEATPDQLQMRLGVVTETVDVDQAMVENNQRMAAVMELLAEIGISGDEMVTGQFQLSPQWSLPPRPTPANWQRQIVGYRVTNELLISTTRVELAGRLLAVAQQAGANQIGGLQFTLANPDTYRQQAIKLATEKAIREAETLARAAHVKLGPVQTLTLEDSGGIPGPQLMMAEARLAAADSVPVAAGKVDITAVVSIVYLLEVGKMPSAR